MAYNELLAERVRAALANQQIPFTETVSFGQLNFMVYDLFCAGVSADELEIRIAPETVASGLEGRTFRLLDDTGRRLKGFIALAPGELETDEQLAHWIALAVEFNTLLREQEKPRVRRIKGCRTSHPI